MEKDFINAKTLATILEVDAARLRAATISPLVLAGGEDVKTEEGDMIPASTDDDDDPEPKERGSDATERRIEKVMADMRDQGLIDINDEKAYELKKVEKHILTS